MESRSIRVLYLSLFMLLMAACAPSSEEVPATEVATSTETPVPAATNTTEPSPTPTALPPMLSSGSIAFAQRMRSFGGGELQRSLEFSPDGFAIAAAGGNSYDFDIRIWEVDSGLFLRPLSGHSGIIFDIVFSPDGRYLASASADGTAKIWRWESGDLVQTIDFPGQVVSVAFSADSQTFAMGGSIGFPDAEIRTYTVDTWNYQRSLIEYWNIPDINFSADGRLIVGGGTSRNVGVWDAVTGEQLFTLNHSSQISSLAISPDSRYLATGLCQEAAADLSCTIGAVWLWDLQTGTLVETLPAFGTAVQDLEYSVDGSLLLAGSQNHVLTAFDTRDYSSLYVDGASNGGILGISPDGYLFATVGSIGDVNIWGIASVQ